MATQAMACPTALADYHCNRHSGLRTAIGNASCVSNTRIAIAAKVLVQLKLKVSPEKKNIASMMLTLHNTYLFSADSYE
jgi:hypothetical protein